MCYLTNHDISYYTEQMKRWSAGQDDFLSAREAVKEERAMMKTEDWGGRGKPRQISLVK